MGDKTENENTLAETEGPGGDGNDMDCMCREGMRRVGAAQTGAAQTGGVTRVWAAQTGAAQTGGVTRARGVAWAGDASRGSTMGAAMPILTASAGHHSERRQECQC